jgi:hypothetical protein
MPLPLAALFSELSYFRGWDAWFAEHDFPLVIIMYPFGAYLLLRSVLWGVWIRGDDIVVHDWFWTRRLPISEVLDVRIVAYSGMINSGGESWTFRVLSFHRAGKWEPWRALGTLSLRYSARRQLASIRAALGMPELMNASGVGRSSRSARRSPSSK